MTQKLVYALVGAMILLGIAQAQSFKPNSGPHPGDASDFDPADTIAYSTPLSFCLGGSVVLTANNAPAGAGFQWKKDGADISGATSVSYTAVTSGSYSVVVSNGGNAVTYPAVTVTVHPYPVAGFSFSPSGACANTPVFFTNTSTGAGASYSWNFGDNNSGSNNTSTLINPSHVFVGTTGNGNQNFTVTLIAGINGCKDTATATVTTKQVPGTEMGGTGFTTYNGLPYFTQCASATSSFTFTNQSSTASTNTHYIIKWGDNSADFVSTSWSSTTHTYDIGTYTLEYIVTGQNGCKDTATYFVFVGNNPAVGLNNPGNTFICSGTSLTFPISGTTNNPPGTVYTVIFNDGTPAITYNHPPPASVTHQFDMGSCGVNSGGFANSFEAMIRASNPCGTSAAAVVPIYVSQKGVANFDISPNDTVCVSNTVSFTNTSMNSFGVSSSGVCTPGKGIWSITPATGWTITSGSLGNDFGQADPALWTNGSNTLNVKFNTPGVYSIRLKVGGSSICSPDEITKTICVNPEPAAAFSLSQTQGCAPLAVSVTNNSNTPLCGNNSYQWTVSYANSAGCTPNAPGYTYAGGTNASSANPQFLFNNPGVYTISLVTRSPGGTCVSSPVSHTVTVKAKPAVVINAPTAVCQNGSISPTALVNNCYSTTPATYAWSFPGGSPASANTADPGTISYNTSGTFTISLTVNNECGATTVTRNITVNPAPDVTVPANLTLCAGSPTGPLNFSSSVAGASFSWTNSNTSIGLPASGNGSISSFNPVNNGSTAQTATITVTPTSGCQGPGKSFTITVNPRPATPIVSSPVAYCQNAAAAQLTAVGSPGNTLTWYNNPALNNGSSTAPTPSTSSPGSTTWYVTQSNSFNCSGPPASITVTVHAAIWGNTIGSDQNICTNGTPNTLISPSAIGGGNGSFAYQWQVSTDNGASWTSIPGATSASFSPGALSASVKYRRVVTSNSCSDTSNVVTILVQGSLSGYGISANQTICAGSLPAQLMGEQPTGGDGNFQFQWEQSLNNVNWTAIAGASGQHYQPPALNTTAFYRRKTTSGPCSAYSASVQVTVNPKPVTAPAANRFYCNNATVNDISFTTTPANNISYTWTSDNMAIGLAAAGTGTLPAFTALNNANPKIPLTANIALVPTYTNNAVACMGDTVHFSITVLPTITLQPVNDTVVCTGATIAGFTPVHDAAVFTGSSVSYGWSVTGSGISLTNGQGISIPSFTAVNTGATDLVATITVTPRYSFGGKTCEGQPHSYTVTVKPDVPPASAGGDATLCAANSFTLQASQPVSASGSWTQISGPAVTITNPASATSQVTGLSAGNTYQFVWTLSGFASCAPTKDTVSITVLPEIMNTINTSPQIICAGQAVSIGGNQPSGGNGTYQYQWQQSTDNINWTPIAGQNGISLSFSPSQTVYVRRLVNSLPCTSQSLSVLVTVHPALTNNTISANQSICINTAPATLAGAQPAGGNGGYQYQWQQSSNGGASWNDIAGANGQDYSPGNLTMATQFRRLVTTSLCSGPQASASNIVTIGVNPDARAEFLPTDTMGCVPFEITPAVVNLQPYPAQNSQYAWYVNDVFLGNGSSFPGHTMSQADDTITIKLVALSTFGCLNDSMSRRFYTQKLPEPSFTLSDTVGCGPLTVHLNNTTPDQAAFSYFWDFGNGQTSTLPQPGTVTLLPHPGYGDTTYIIRLHVISACDTVTVSDSVRVKSQPKALFSPGQSVGCSPLTVTFNNISGGLNNNYDWDFGDGSAPVSTGTAGPISYTFITGVQDTFHVRLMAFNECGSDTLSYAIVVSPNHIELDFAINGNQFSGCAPHTVGFINNSSGATQFTWNFGDNNILNTTQNIDTVSHSYTTPGTYSVTLHATNGCSDTSTVETIVVYARPQAAFTSGAVSVCIGDTIQFSNQSQGASSYLWTFGDTNSSTFTNPLHAFTTPGVYSVKLVAYSFNAPATVCTDTAEMQVQVNGTAPGNMILSDSAGFCAPFTVTFTNPHQPSVSQVWDFGDGHTGSGDVVSHTYAQAGIYQVNLTVTVTGGCTYTAQKTVQVLGPSGSWQHTTGYLCNSQTASFQVLASHADSILYYFGDGSYLASTSNLATHVYANPGVYLPTVVLKNNAGCLVTLSGMDSVRVDRLEAGFHVTQQNYCGYTLVRFTDTSVAFFGKDSLAWDFGDGTTGSGVNPEHEYTASGTYPVRLVVFSQSGCTDTITKAVTVLVNNKPIAAITASPVACVGYPVQFSSQVQSTDPVNIIHWTLSNGVTAGTASFEYSFIQPGSYDVHLVAGTVHGCYDTVSTSITVNPTPNVTASNDLLLCLGNSAPLQASGTGVAGFSWSPLQGLSCTDCPNPVASPQLTTTYVVQGTNVFGCAAFDTVVVTVIQPLHLTATGNDSICIGSATQLLASGATAYSWSPAQGLNNTSISNPTASPQATTIYRVVGYDGFNCFTDTAYVTVAVGPYPTISLGPDLTLATGTMHPLQSAVQNGPVTSWLWSPSTGLSCNNCPLPLAHVKNDISYTVRATTAFGCSAEDTIRIKAFCESAQVFIPNAFTPNGDGHNDILMVRGSGIALVRSFRIFNRWGEVVFETGNCQPNNPQFGWDGKIKRVAGGPDVFVYTAEVVCENGSTYTYKGNVTVLK